MTRDGMLSSMVTEWKLIDVPELGAPSPCSCHAHCLADKVFPV